MHGARGGAPKGKRNGASLIGSGPRSRYGSSATWRLMRPALSRVGGLLASHQPQEFGFVNVAVFDEAGD